MGWVTGVSMGWSPHNHAYSLCTKWLGHRVYVCLQMGEAPKMSGSLWCSLGFKGCPHEPNLETIRKCQTDTSQLEDSLVPGLDAQPYEVAHIAAKA